VRTQSHSISESKWGIFPGSQVQERFSHRLWHVYIEFFVSNRSIIPLDKMRDEKKKKNPWLINQRKGLINGLIFNFEQHSITYIAKVKIFIYRISILFIAENFPFNFINICYAINYKKKIKIWTRNYYCEFVKI